ncbi:hypothetical protein LVJ83_12285 [Uruburuella testudinis]|uniref:Uncharacterized protein n=1 Tax=Uruburuella testudinis TaxID=1282863 RepID=A0ABY4DS00_9NEIS|nr:hypothetical protein [Uruburuella testudinis]UOO81683.1 hypothetical protein LVJ83_12285 [Uruburuella testudinis]
MKTTAALLITAALGFSAPAMAAGFAHQQDISYAGQTLKVADTSARLLGNAQGNAPELVADINDGLGKTKTPGYKIQIMSRSYSLAADARPAREGQGWSNNRAIHRGVKLLIGIPVSNGQADLANAKLLGLALISDAAVPDTFKAEDKIRPRGKQLVTKEAKISRPTLQLTELQLPDFAGGERSGGGVKLHAAAQVDGKPLNVTVNSTFREFEVAKPDAARGFGADARVVK